MQLHSINPKDAPTVLLVPGMAVRGDLAFKDLIHLIKDDYQILLVQLSGERGVGVFDSIEVEAKLISQALKEEGLKIDLAFGSSLGANILIELMAHGDIVVDNVFLDAPFLMGWPKFLIRLVSPMFCKQMMKHQTNKEEARQYLLKKIPYGKTEDVDAMVEILDLDYQYESLLNQGIAAYTYQIPDQVRRYKQPVIGLAGSDETFALKSFNKLADYLPQLQEVFFPHRGHGGPLFHHVDEVAAIIRQHINQSK